VEISVYNQAAVFFGALCLGFAIGLSYDLIRIPRAYIPIPFLGAVLDLLFWLFATAAFFIYAIIAGGGELRIFIAAALFTGAVLYFFLLSPWIRKFSDLMARGAAALWNFMTFPAVHTAIIVKKIIGKLKNSFSSARKRYKIHRIVGETGNGAQQRTAGTGGGAHGENQKSRNPDEAGRTGAAGIFGDHAAQPAQSDTVRPDRAGHADAAGADQNQLNAELNAAVKDSDDPDRIADAAREKLGLVEPGEKVFVFTN
jgi:hypothetical protein